MTAPNSASSEALAVDDFWARKMRSTFAVNAIVHFWLVLLQPIFAFFDRAAKFTILVPSISVRRT